MVALLNFGAWSEKAGRCVMVVAVWIVLLCFLVAEKCLVYHGKSLSTYLLLDSTDLIVFICVSAFCIYAKIPLTCVDRD